MARLMFTVTIDFVDDEEMDNFAGPIQDGLTDYLADVQANNPFVTEFNITEE